MRSNMATLTREEPDRTVPQSACRNSVVLHRGEAAYEAMRSGFNIAIEHHPEVIIEARSPADVVAAVRMAAHTGRPLAVMNTGHGPSVSADGAVLVRTGRMNRVDVDAVRGTAVIQAGAVWRDVIAASTPYGLAPLCGSSPDVGAVGYTLGGGIGLLARRFGFAADHVRWLDVVTADGCLRRASAESNPDLFWALRGAGANFGVVTAMEIDLFPVATVLGGELTFSAEACADVLSTYADWARSVPETMSSSILLLRYPDDPSVARELRGRHVTHVRIAYCGDDHRAGETWVEQLRRIAPRVLDTVRTMPYDEIGTIHHEPTDTPVAAFDRNILLDDFDRNAASVLLSHAGPAADAPFVVELRAWGGALSRPPRVPNAIGGREAAYSLLAIADSAAEHRAKRDALLAAMHPWATGGIYTNFAGVEDSLPSAVRRAYRSQDFARLQEIKAAYDPRNLFRVNFNIPSERTSPSFAQLAPAGAVL